MRGFKISKFIVLFFVLLTVAVSSCRTAREVSKAKLKPVSSKKLLKYIDNNSFDYKYFTIKRINCQFIKDNKKTNFTARVKALKDKKILVSVNKMKIPVARVLLTPDSVVYVNYIDHNYFTGDYSYLKKMLNVDIDFNLIQSVISNSTFSYRINKNVSNQKKYKSFVEDGMYVLESGNPKKHRIKKTGRSKNILQKTYFEPVAFTITKLLLEDKNNNRYMNIDFADFVDVENKKYPGNIALSFKTPASNVVLKLKLKGFSTAEIKSFNIKIPEKYEQIKVSKN